MNLLWLHLFKEISYRIILNRVKIYKRKSYVLMYNDALKIE